MTLGDFKSSDGTKSVKTYAAPDTTRPLSGWSVAELKHDSESKVISTEKTSGQEQAKP